ncbi:hypothetical protein COO91_05103 [Nostoc flagelliforme CCNUN1]|uniref:Uncharacterized protein n=1 Tax=Nostoc flagelliforme CCNUN1 TaxID=2038116 RepID=A0A2K8SWI7_9NOSO|nr:hypothetical protein COO91_05103 [Nostoc flagelliforme CCNUN1]
MCIWKVHFYKIGTANIYLIPKLKSNQGMLINKIVQLK